MRKVEDLNLKSIKVIQDDSLYCFTSDAILLSKFARVKKGDVVADFCAGSGVVGFNLYGINSELIKSVTFFELQKSMFDMCLESIKLNGLEDKFSAINTAVQEISNEFNQKFSLIVCNPPYMDKKGGFVSDKSEIAICKSEIALPLTDLVKAFNRNLKYGGRVCMCHRADRMVEIICEFVKNGIQPKRVQFVNAPNKDPYLVLIEGVKGGKAGIKVLNTIQN